MEYFSPYLLSHINMRPDKYIRDMIKDSKGHIWSGGYYNLKCFDLATNSVRLYPGVSSITAIAEKDSHNMWIGTAMGLYLLNRDSGKYEYIKLEAGSTYINTLYQADNGLLYVGTNGAGVFIYDAQNKKFGYKLRPVDDYWNMTFHPCAQMNFVAYGNKTNVDRQTSCYSTRTYTRYLVN